MNTKGQAALLGFIFSLITFFIIWAIWLGGILNEWGAKMIEDNGLTGIEAFMAGNLNLWVGLGLFITILWILYAGGNQ